MAEISIVVPVYNGERFLGRCLDSILDQTFDNVKVIAVNDGSSDSSLEILKEYKKRYPEKIEIHTQKNAGVASARNKGVALTGTKYLMFMDQDDYIDADYCQTFYEAAEAGGYDIVLGGFKRPGTGSRIINNYVKLKDTPYAKYVCTTLYAKIHKTAFVKKHNIEVFPTKYGEDIVFTLHEYAKTHNIKVIDYVGYNWFYNKESVSNTSQKKILDILPPLLVLLDKQKKYDVDKSVEHEYFVLQTVVFYFLWTGRAAKYNDFMHAHKEVFKWLEKKYPDFQKNKYILFGPKGAPLLNRISISVFMMAHRWKCISLFAKIYCKG